jgi:deazaflavin-dependent oxidoreductase (nitroreductase family)
VPLPNWLARVNRRLTNPLFGPAASRLPYFAVILHRGRVSGRLYRTPVNAFPTDDGFIVALTYGSSTDWVRNVLSSGECEIEHRGRRVRLVAHRVVGKTESVAAVPSFVRFVLDLLGVQDFLQLDTGRS